MPTLPHGLTDLVGKGASAVTAGASAVVSTLPTPGAVGEAILEGIDAAVDQRWDEARQRAAGTSGTTRQRVAQVRDPIARELATAGAGAGGLAALPGAGTGAALGVGIAELGWIAVRSADLILTIAAIHGHDDATVDERRTWILLVLVYGDGATEALAKLAAGRGQGPGGRLTKLIPTDALRRINRGLGRSVVTRYGARRGAVALGELLPFGIGAVVGGTANWGLAHELARNADTFFGQLSPGS